MSDRSLAVLVEQTTNGPVFWLSGQLDAAGAPHLLAMVAAGTDPWKDLVLDCRNLVFFDRAGGDALEEVQRAAAALRRRTVLRAPLPFLVSVLELWGIEDRYTIV
ncbi:MAG: hypothetical protein JWL70_1527 [Acidimicrobiia bacterium]|nr:hypothetical protein [Acidimicrobiia bacterium]